MLLCACSIGSYYVGHRTVATGDYDALSAHIESLVAGLSHIVKPGTMLLFTTIDSRTNEQVLTEEYEICGPMTVKCRVLCDNTPRITATESVDEALSLEVQPLSQVERDIAAGEGEEATI